MHWSIEIAQNLQILYWCAFPVFLILAFQQAMRVRFSLPANPLPGLHQIFGMG